MKKWIWIFALMIGLAIVGGYLGYHFIYNKPHLDYEEARAEYSLTDQELFSQFSENRLRAEQLYNGKVLEVSGTVSSVETPDSLTILVFALQEGMFGAEGIRCTMLESHSQRAANMAGGVRVTIKGFCAGYNDTDVILEKCSFIK